MTVTYPYSNPRIKFDVPQPDPQSRLILNLETNRYVRLGLHEYEWLRRLDGRISSADIPALFDRDPAFVEEFLQRLAVAKLICLTDQPMERGAAKLQAQAPKAVRRFEWARFGQMRFHIGQWHALFDRLARCHSITSTPALAIGLVISAFGLILGFKILRIADLPLLLQTYVWHPWNIGVLVALVFAGTVMHELGHGIACTCFGIQVRSVGVMMFYLQPAAYVDVTDSWQLKNRWQRVAIAAAGVYVQLVITCLACCFWIYLRAVHHESDLLRIFIGLTVYSAVFNLLPFVKLDGYWMLSNIVGIPNLIDRAQEWFMVSVVSAATRRPIESKQLRYTAVLSMTPLGRGLMACFGASATIFSLSMWLVGIATLFQITRWLRMPPGFSCLVVSGVL